MPSLQFYPDRQIRKRFALDQFGTDTKMKPHKVTVNIIEDNKELVQSVTLFLR